MSDKKFFTSLDAVLGEMVGDMVEYVRDDDVTIQRLIDAAKADGRDLKYSTALRLIESRVKAGILKHEGMRKKRDTGKHVNVWVLAAKK